MSLTILLDPSVRLHPGQLIPDGAARGVAKEIQGAPGRFEVLLSQAQVLLHSIQHTSAPSVDAVVIKALLEVRHIGGLVLVRLEVAS